MTNVDLEKLAARIGRGDTGFLSWAGQDIVTAIAEALRLKARLDWLMVQPEWQLLHDQSCEGNIVARARGRTGLWSAVADPTPRAAIDGLKAKLEPQPAPEPPPHEHVWSLWFPNEQDNDEVFTGHESSSYQRSCYTCPKTEYADALVPAGSERLTGGTLHENASASPPSTGRDVKPLRAGPGVVEPDSPYFPKPESRP